MKVPPHKAVTVVTPYILLSTRLQMCLIMKNNTGRGAEIDCAATGSEVKIIRSFLEKYISCLRVLLVDFFPPYFPAIAIPPKRITALL